MRHGNEYFMDEIPQIPLSVEAHIVHPTPLLNCLKIFLGNFGNCEALRIPSDSVHELTPPRDIVIMSFHETSRMECAIY